MPRLVIEELRHSSPSSSTASISRCYKSGQTDDTGRILGIHRRKRLYGFRGY